MRVFRVPLLLVPIGAIKPPSPFNNLAADFIRQAGPDIAKELLKKFVSKDRCR